MESQTRVSKRAPREFRNWRVQGNPLTPSPTLRQPCANPSPTLRQPFANLFCQPLSEPLFPWAPGTRLETLVNRFLGIVLQEEQISITEAGLWKCRQKVSDYRYRTECTTPSHLQSLANFVANIHSQGISAARTKFLPFHSQNHSHSLANSSATPNLQLSL